MGLLLSITFIAFVAINVPIAFSMGLASILGLLMKGDIPLVIVPQKVFTGSDSFPLLAVPFFILAIVCAACGMGILVPPCIAMVVYGGVANVSIGALFAGGFLPAFVMAAALMTQLNVQARQAGVSPGHWPGIKPLVKAFKESLLALFMPIIIFGGILGGICTPTEAAVLAVAYGLVISMFIYREITVPKLLEILLETGIIT
jgi:C4-dicarboxylate transporter DctM subunit